MRVTIYLAGVLLDCLLVVTSNMLASDTRKDKVINAWFVDSATIMNPHMLYSQAIYGKVTGRGIGIIDAYHFVEVTRSVKVLSDNGAIPRKDAEKIKAWFGRLLRWMTTHEYGIAEMNWNNNHDTCWAATAASMAVFTENSEIINLCKTNQAPRIFTF